MLVEAKRSIWNNINANISELWSLIQTIFQQEELMQNVKAAVEQTKIKIEHRPTKAHIIIKMLNSKTKDELEELHIQDITCTIMEVKRFLTKKNLMI